jgi:hypothetical protein
VLRREPGAAALDFFGRLGLTPAELDAALFGSDEYFIAFGGSTPAGFVTAAWNDILGRPIDAGGLDLFAGALARGATREQVAFGLLSSNEAMARRSQPAILGASPAAGSLVESLDSVTVAFAVPVLLATTSMTVTVGGLTLAGTIAQGDFADTVVFNVADIPEALQRGVTHRVRVHGVVDDGSALRPFDIAFDFRPPRVSLTRGDTGDRVAALQHRLAQLGYWLGTPDGAYGERTTQAVMAFQKAERLPVTGTADVATLAVVNRAVRPRPRSTSGDLIEVDKARQLLFVVRGGQVAWVFNTSTGTEQPYTYEGRTLLADTPPGRHRVSREIDGIREGELGRLYRPKYFHPDGIAVHGSSSVPQYPASHGCVRVTNAAIDWMWANNIVPLGTTVWVY